MKNYTVRYLLAAATIMALIGWGMNPAHAAEKKRKAQINHEIKRLQDSL